MDEQNISLKRIILELLQTSLFKEIAKRNGQEFAQHLAVWLVRYTLVMASMEESLKLGFEKILLNLHGKKYKKILDITERTFQNNVHEDEEHHRYIW
jgi:diketogulonate reductase-like aldo/keto reductase